MFLLLMLRKLIPFMMYKRKFTTQCWFVSSTILEFLVSPVALLLQVDLQLWNLGEGG